MNASWSINTRDITLVVTSCWWVMSPTKSVTASFSTRSAVEKAATSAKIGRCFSVIIIIIVRFEMNRFPVSLFSSCLRCVPTGRHETLTSPWKPDVVTMPRNNGSCRWCRWTAEGESGVLNGTEWWVSSTIYLTYLERKDDTQQDMKINSKSSLRTFNVNHVLDIGKRFTWTRDEEKEISQQVLIDPEEDRKWFSEENVKYFKTKYTRQRQNLEPGCVIKPSAVFNVIKMF